MPETSCMMGCLSRIRSKWIALKQLLATSFHFEELVILWHNRLGQNAPAKY